MGKMEKQCNFFSGFSEVEILVKIFFQFHIYVFLFRGDCAFFLDRVTSGFLFACITYDILSYF